MINSNFYGKESLITKKSARLWEPLEWPKSKSVDVININSFHAVPDNTGIWLKPQRRNQVGFDAVYLQDIGKPEHNQKYCKICSIDSRRNSLVQNWIFSYVFERLEYPSRNS